LKATTALRYVEVSRLSPSPRGGARTDVRDDRSDLSLSRHYAFQPSVDVVRAFAVDVLRAFAVDVLFKLVVVHPFELVVVHPFELVVVHPFELEVVHTPRPAYSKT